MKTENMVTLGAAAAVATGNCGLEKIGENSLQTGARWAGNAAIAGATFNAFGDKAQLCVVFGVLVGLGGFSAAMLCGIIAQTVCHTLGTELSVDSGANIIWTVMGIAFLIWLCMCVLVCVGKPAHEQLTPELETCKAFHIDENGIEREGPGPNPVELPYPKLSKWKKNTDERLHDQATAYLWNSVNRLRLLKLEDYNRYYSRNLTACTPARAVLKEPCLGALDFRALDSCQRMLNEIAEEGFVWVEELEDEGTINRVYFNYLRKNNTV